MRKGNPKQGSRLPSLDLLKGFEAAARRLSFTEAGEELHRTQSAVSRQIQELEEQLGVALFHRRHRALTLTEALPSAIANRSDSSSATISARTASTSDSKASSTRSRLSRRWRRAARV